MYFLLWVLIMGYCWHNGSLTIIKAKFSPNIYTKVMKSIKKLFKFQIFHVSFNNIPAVPGSRFNTPFHLRHHHHNQHSWSLGMLRENEASSCTQILLFYKQLCKAVFDHLLLNSSHILFPLFPIVCLFLLYGKGRAHLPLLLPSTWAGHLHVPATRLLVEERIQPGVVVGFITEEAGAFVGLLLTLGLVTEGLWSCWRGLFWLLGLCRERVKVWVKGVGWSVLGAFAPPLRQEWPPPLGPLSCHLWQEVGN